jgi:uncharacterized protein YndB with AHSA1/START domain
MANTGINAVETAASREVVTERHELEITRVFNAPRELVWRAWTDPEMTRQWQAPKIFEVTHLEQDMRVGGKVRKCMRGLPPGAERPVEIWLRGEVLEVKPPELLVYTYAWEDRAGVGLIDDGDPHETVVTVKLEEKDGRTTMHFHQAPFSAVAERDGHDGGWSSGFERLEEMLSNIH